MPLIGPESPPAQRDLMLIVAATIAVAFVSVHFELSELVLGWARRWERYQIDELPGILFFVAVALAWFALRRVREARAELRRRIALEDELADALEENRRLSRSHVQAQEEERKSLARELHDELGQHMNAIKIDAVSIRDCGDGLTPDVMRAATSIVGISDHVHGAIRDIMRRLRPAGLDELGLQAAIEHCIDGWRARFPDIDISFKVEGDFDTLGEALNITLYRVTQEGLTNVTRHARARRVGVRLIRADGVVTFTLEDDGVGASLSRETTGLGLVGMRERVEALGGGVKVTTVPGQGFCVTARIPLGQGPA
jgi:signal transduction histidine kinase